MKKYLTIIFPIVLLVSCTSNTSMENKKEENSSAVVEYATGSSVFVNSENVSENIQTAESVSIVSDEVEAIEFESNF